MTHVSHQLASIRVLGYLVLLLLLSTTSASPSWEAKPRLPKCKSSKSSNGFHHPGIYHDCRSLDRIQHNYQSGKWAYTEALNLVVARTPSLQKNESWEMQGPFYEVNWAGGDGHNIPLQNDGKAAYMLTLGWYATGNSTWLERARHIVHEWSTTLRVLNEHIQGGEGLAYITASAEILRATAKHSGWTTQDTEDMKVMITSISAPWTEVEGLTRINFFMNQGWYGNNGAMTIAVFGENRTLYEKMIHQATVGSNPIPSLDYAVPRQILNDTDHLGQVVEMGRDEYHPMGTLRGLSLSGHTSLIQRGIDYFGMLDNRLMHGWEYWAKYNNGSDVNWKPLFIGAGDESWPIVSPNGRGRNYEQYWQPVEAIGIGYYEYSRRGKARCVPWLTEYMSWQGVGWSTFEWGFDKAIHHLGYSLEVVKRT